MSKQGLGEFLEPREDGFSKAGGAILFNGVVSFIYSDTATKPAFSNGFNRKHLSMSGVVIVSISPN